MLVGENAGLARKLLLVLKPSFYYDILMSRVGNFKVNLKEFFPEIFHGGFPWNFGNFD